MTAIRMSVCVAALLTLAITARPAAAFPIDFILTDANGKRQQLSEYWVGLFCDEVGDDLRAHIDLPKGQGVIVRKVFDDSAAAKAGFQAHDILLKAGKTKLTTPLDLVKSVQGAKGKSLTFEVLRKGKKTSIEVTPQKRPVEQRFTNLRKLELEPLVVNQLEAEKRRLIEQLMKQQKDVRFLVVEPGKVVPKNLRLESAAALPNGVSVSITKTNNEPAKISVKRGKESWDVTEKELDKLPEDIRPGIKAMLNNNAPIRLRLRDPGLIDGPFGGGNGRIVIRKFDESETKTVEKILDEEDNVQDLAEELRKLAEKIEKLEKAQKKK